MPFFSLFPGRYVPDDPLEKALGLSVAQGYGSFSILATLYLMLRDIALVILFILIAGVFVAAEIALISLRESQVRQIESKGKRGARVAKLSTNPNRFLAAAQVGITFCGFLSAALGSERIGARLEPKLELIGLSPNTSKALSLIAITLVISYISLVLGELVPKRLALYRTEWIALAAAPTIDRIANIFRPAIWLLSKSTDAIMKIFGLRDKGARNEISEAELVDLVTGHTSLSIQERDIVEEVFNAGDLQIHEVMVPRTEVDFIDVGLTVGQAIELAKQHLHSRYPVTRGSSDEVLGFLHVRDLLQHSATPDKKIMDLLRPVIFLPGTKGVLPALEEMRIKHHHLAIVLDEYGGTDGIITLENLLESFVGEISDEYDEEESEIKQDSRSGEYEVDALISLEDLYDETGIAIPDGPYETAGGYVMHHLGRLPRIHDVVNLNGSRITVLTIEGKRAGKLLISSNEWKDSVHGR
jgi:putative hemolysin